MGTKKYTEKQIEEAISLRKKGFSKPVISEKTQININSLSKIFKENKIFLTTEQKESLVIGARWKNYAPVIDNKKRCSKCQEYVNVENFTKQTNSKSGLSDSCRKCQKSTYSANNETIKDKVKKYRNKNLNKIKNSQTEYYEENKEKIIERVTLWRSQNKEKIKTYERNYNLKNPGAKNERTARYRASKNNATPRWLTDDHKKQIKEMYKKCPEGHHVDHIIPIRSDVVCGLHVPWNLQYLKKEINESKGASFFDFNSIGVCHQYKVKMATEEEDRNLGMPFGCSIDDLIFSKETLSEDHVKFIERYEWLGTVGYLVRPEVYVAKHYLGFLAGVVIIDQPNSFTKGIEKKHEALIHRGATTSWAPKNLGSKLVMYACRESVKNSDKRIFFAYSDPSAGEIGTIYQACNFRYLGNRFGAKTKFIMPNGKSVSGRYFTKTSTFKRYCKELGISWETKWQKQNGYKNLKAIPSDILRILKEKGKQEMLSCESLIVPPKGKYVIILGKNKKEHKELKKKYDHLLPSFEYIKRKF